MDAVELRKAILRALTLGKDTSDTVEMITRLIGAWSEAGPSVNSGSPEPRMPAFDPTRHHLQTEFPDVAEAHLREKAQQAHYQWHNTKREAERATEQLPALWDEFEKFEDAADVLMRARGGGPQPPTETAPAFVPPREGVDY